MFAAREEVGDDVTRWKAFSKRWRFVGVKGVGGSLRKFIFAEFKEPKTSSG
jgi:hypothetical protein